ncbi:predicted protein [Naegleria gruberi]|uniref:Predicted protein n=1 Tax=Naegleria gruberi TaxID=5762 RepID=D2V6Z6_NAEGR|nr:uncharacterized protein NAEGRDRAFT_64611 [Naegleria gruberi]EFC47167.1 predicted protein [Naegleria gruberi]|eukprot:XP_002679911.1 predicted protein [Naegleria gruberi strain NEG-M]
MSFNSYQKETLVKNTDTTLEVPADIAKIEPSSLCVMDNGDIIFVEKTILKRFKSSSKTVELFLGKGSRTDDGVDSKSVDSTSASMNNVVSVFKSPATGDCVYMDQKRVRMISKTTNLVTTIAGSLTSTNTSDGQFATSAKFFPKAFTIDEYGNLYVVDFNVRIRKVSNTTKMVSAFSGATGTSASTLPIDGSPANTNLGSISSLLAKNDIVYFTVSNAILKVVNGAYYTVAGSWIACTPNATFEGDAKSACFDQPKLVTISDGEILLTDNSLTIRKIDRNGVIKIVAGTGSDIIDISRQDQMFQNVTFLLAGISVEKKNNELEYYLSIGGAIFKAFEKSTISAIVKKSLNLSYSSYDYGLQFKSAKKIAQVFRNGDILIIDPDNQTLYRFSRQTGILSLFTKLDITVTMLFVEDLNYSFLYMASTITSWKIYKFYLKTKSLELIAGNDTGIFYKFDGQKALETRIYGIDDIKIHNHLLYYRDMSLNRIMELNPNTGELRSYFGNGEAQGKAVGGINGHLLGSEFIRESASPGIMTFDLNGVLYIRNTNIVVYIDKDKKLRRFIGKNGVSGLNLYYPVPIEDVLIGGSSTIRFHPTSGNCYLNIYNSTFSSIYQVSNGMLTEEIRVPVSTSVDFALTSNGSIYYLHDGLKVRHKGAGTSEVLISLGTYNRICLSGNDTLILSTVNSLIYKYNINTRVQTSLSLYTWKYIRTIHCSMNSSDVYVSDFPVTNPVTYSITKITNSYTSVVSVIKSPYLPYDIDSVASSPSGELYLLATNAVLYQLDSNTTLEPIGGLKINTTYSLQPMSRYALWSIAPNGDVYFREYEDDNPLRIASPSANIATIIPGNGTLYNPTTLNGYNNVFGEEFTKDGYLFIMSMFNGEKIPDGKTLTYSPFTGLYFYSDFDYKFGQTTKTRDGDYLYLTTSYGIERLSVDCVRDRYGFCYQEDPFCFGIHYNNVSACGGQGVCFDYNSCECEEGYFGQDCSLRLCFGTLSNESELVCSGNGKCNDTDTCQCNDGYFSTQCEITTCFGILSNDTSVCSSHGNCSSWNNCSCLEGYYGIYCNESKSFGNENNTISNNTFQSNETHIENTTISSNSTLNSTISNSTFEITNSSQIENSTLQSNNSNSNNVSVINNTTEQGTNNSLISNETLNNSTDISNHSMVNDTLVSNSTYHGTNFTQMNNDSTVRNDTNINLHSNSTNNSSISNNTVSNSNTTEGRNYTQFNDTMRNETISSNITTKETLNETRFDNMVNNSIVNSTLNSNNSQILNDSTVSNNTSMFECFGKMFNNSLVCNGHGSCISQNLCKCHDLYFGVECQNKSIDPITCYGINQSNDSVCNNGGVCISNDTCQCKTGYYGTKCSVFLLAQPNFNNYGNTLEFHFKTSITMSDHVVDCKKIIVTVDNTIFGENPTCYWKNSNFFIELGGQHSIRQNITINVNGLDDSESRTLYLSLTVIPSLNPVKPVAVLSYKKLISSCEMIEIDASQSYCGDLKPLKYIWSIESSDDPKLSFQNIIYTNEFNSSIRVDNGSSGVYIFGLIIQSSLSGVSSEKEFITITKSTVPSPTISIINSKLSNVELNSVPIIIKKTIEFPSCYFGNKEFTYVWTKISGSSLNYEIDSNNDLVIKEFQDGADQIYSFQLQAQFDSHSNSSTSSVTISTKSKELELNIFTSSLSTSEATLQVEYSDPDNLQSTEEWTWKCLDSKQACQDASITSSLALCSKKKSETCTIQKSTLSKFDISLLIQKGSRFIEKSIEVTFPSSVSNIPPAISLVSVYPKRFKVTKDEILSLQLSVILNGDEKITLEENISREWTMNDKSIDASMTTLMKSDISKTSSLILSLSELLEDTEYTLTLKATDIINGLASLYSYSFKVVKSPKSCKCSISPSSGYALETSFSFSCPNCQNAEGTIDFVFGFIDDKSGVKIPLYNLGEKFATYFPSPYTGETLSTFVSIVDTDTGASVEIKKEVLILTPVAKSVTETKKKVTLWQKYASSASDSAKLVFNSATISRTAELMLAKLNSKRSAPCSNHGEYNSESGKCECDEGYTSLNCLLTVEDYNAIYSLREEMIDRMIVGINERNPLELLWDVHLKIFIFGLESIAASSESISSLPFEKMFNLTEKLIFMANQNTKLRTSYGVDYLINSLLNHFMRLLRRIENSYRTRLINLLKMTNKIFMRNYFVGQVDYSVNLSEFSSVASLNYRNQHSNKIISLRNNTYSIRFDEIMGDVSNRIVLSTSMFSISDCFGISSLLSKQFIKQVIYSLKNREESFSKQLNLMTNVIVMDKKYESNHQFIFNMQNYNFTNLNLEKVSHQVESFENREIQTRNTVNTTLECTPLESLFDMSVSNCSTRISYPNVICVCPNSVSSIVILEKILTNTLILNSEDIMNPILPISNQYHLYGLFGLFGLLVVILLSCLSICLIIIVCKLRKKKTKKNDSCSASEKQIELITV